MFLVQLCMHIVHLLFIIHHDPTVCTHVCILNYPNTDQCFCSFNCYSRNNINGFKSHLKILSYNDFPQTSINNPASDINNKEDSLMMSPLVSTINLIDKSPVLGDNELIFNT